AAPLLGQGLRPAGGGRAGRRDRCYRLAHPRDRLSCACGRQWRRPRGAMTPPGDSVGSHLGAFFCARKPSEGSTMETIDTTTAGVAEARQRVLREVGEAEIKFVRLWFTDLVGRLKSFAITRDELASALDHGMGFDGSSVTHLNPIEDSDIISIPDPASSPIITPASGEHAAARMF